MGRAFAKVRRPKWVSQLLAVLAKPAEKPKQKNLVEGEDYYVEGGRWVFTAKYLSDRGYCCEKGCRHCPYGFKQT